MAPTKGVSTSGNQENGRKLRSMKRTTSGQGWSLNETAIEKLNSRNPIRPFKPRNKRNKRKSANQSGPDTEENIVTSSSDRDPSGGATYSESQNMSENKRQKVLTSPNSELIGVPRFDSLDMHYEDDTILITPPPRGSLQTTFSFNCQPESSRSLLNPVAAASVLVPRFQYTSSPIPQRPAVSSPEPEGRVRRTFIDEFGLYASRNQINLVPATSSPIRPELQPRKSFKRRSANLSLIPAKRLSKSSPGSRRAFSKFYKVIDTSGISDISDEETEVITVCDDSIHETRVPPVITISEDSIDEKLPVLANRVKKSVEPNVDLNTSFEEGELPESDDEIEIVGMHLAGSNSKTSAATATVTRIRACTTAKRPACSTPRERPACTPRSTKRKTPRGSARLKIKNRLSGLRSSKNGDGGGGKFGHGTPRNDVGTSVPLTPTNCIDKYRRVKTPQQIATAAAAMNVRRKSIQRYGANAFLRTPQIVNPRIAKRLKRLSRRESLLNTNRVITMRNTSNVSARNERRYQQGNEVNNRRQPYRRNQNMFSRGNGDGDRRNRRPQDNSRPVMRNPIQRSTQFVPNPFSGITNPDFMSVVPGNSKDANQSESSSTTFLIPRNNHEQGISVYGMNMYVPLMVQQKGKLRPIVIDGSNVAMGHGKNKEFSCKGIKICAQYFKDMGHETVLAFVPRFRCKHRESVDTHILKELEDEGVVKYTPSRELGDGRQINSYDDRYVIQVACAMGGIIVSNDNFRDLMEEQPSWRPTIETRVLPFTWIIGDIIMFPPDPLGRDGPPLHEFLRF